MVAKIFSTTIKIPKKVKISYIDAMGDRKEHKRSGVKMSETKNELTVVIETKDVTALRASMNAVFRDVQVVENAGAGT